MYQNNRIKDHELYDAVFHDLFDLISNHWNMLTSIIWNFVNTICYTQEYWIFHSSRKKIRTELIYRFIKESFRQNWTSKRIVYVKKNYRKLFLIIRDWKNELKKTRLNENNESYQSNSHRSNLLLRQFSHLHQHQSLHLFLHRFLHLFLHRFLHLIL
jgi:hypothetical protein